MTQKNCLQFIIPNWFQKKFFAGQCDWYEDARLRKFSNLFCIGNFLFIYFFAGGRRGGQGQGTRQWDPEPGKTEAYVWTRLKGEEVAEGNFVGCMGMFNRSFCESLPSGAWYNPFMHLSMKSVIKPVFLIMSQGVEFALVEKYRSAESYFKVSVSPGQGWLWSLDISGSYYLDISILSSGQRYALFLKSRIKK